ncbi:MAG: RNA methyltransferase [Euryarchaeota archaeon]|nr:RNA methyltransferase [Euryarchaeota archaeon]MBT4924501.1 RNA methyltransferase [Euryarchaeota archaeon]
MGDRQSIPLPKSNYELTIVLIGTSHPGNLGAISRSMLNYGFDKLRLVNPKCDHLDVEARNRAKHAGRILQTCESFKSLEEATSDCSLVVGTSGKREVGSKTTFRHFTYPWEFSKRISQFNGKVALVFGEEGKGMSTDELDMCDFLATLPTWEGYPIANLSHAVNAFVYELHKERVINNQGKDNSIPDIVPLERSINENLREILVKGIGEFSDALPGNDERKTSFKNSMIRSIMLSMPTEDEATRMIGGVLDATTALQYVAGNDEWISRRRRKIEPDSEE